MFWRGQPPAPPLSHFLRWGRWGRGLPGGLGRCLRGELGRWQPARLAGAWPDRNPSVCGEGGLRGSGKGRPAPCASLPGSSNCARLPASSGSGPPPRPPALQSPERSWPRRLGRPSSGRLCHHHRHDRHPAPARLQPEGSVRAPGALLPGSAGGAGEQAAPQHGRAALGPCAQQASPPKGARGCRSGWTERD